jgi:hypothetical protein
MPSTPATRGWPYSWRPTNLTPRATRGGRGADGPVSRVLELPGAPEESGYPRVLVTAAWNAFFERRSSHRRCAPPRSVGTLVEKDPARAKALLRESIERGGPPGEEIPTGVLPGCLVAAAFATGTSGSH